MALAWSNLAKEKLRLALSVLGVALAVLLILLLNGFLTGLYKQISIYLDRSGAAVVVAQKGVRSFLSGSSLLPNDTAGAVEDVPGVGTVTPVVARLAIVDVHDKKVPIYLVGYEPGRGGGPWAMAAGRAPETDAEIVIDEVLARRHGLARGSTFALLGQPFRVVGLSAQTAGFMASFVFVLKAAAEGLLRAPGASSFLLVSPTAGTEPSQLRDTLHGRLPDAEIMLRSELVAEDNRLVARIYGTLLRLMVGVAFLIGALVVGLVIYTATVERRREYGVLKAIGVPNRALYRVVLAQALVATLAGAALGLVLESGAARLIMAVRPQFLIALTPGDIGRTLAASLVMATVAALLPAWVVAALPPAEVFRR